MTGSTVDGEDVLQGTFVKALSARAEGVSVDNFEGWLFLIAHNTSPDLLRRRSRNTAVSLAEDVEAVPMPETDIVAVSFQTFCSSPSFSAAR
jgi:RNA polymerase sigma-70 factor (ECF subfamily)